MTQLQLKYVLACAELGSLSKAARVLATTTSNISKLLRALEDEVGFAIFTRSSSGIEPTQEGQSFLVHAASILDSYRKIADIHTDRRKEVFHCTCTPNAYCFEAFSRLYAQMAEEERFAMALHVGFYAECIEKVMEQKSEIGLISLPRVLEEPQKIMLESNGLTVKFLKKQQISVNLRKGHPALEHYEPGSPFDMEQLRKYPYAGYSNQSGGTEEYLPRDFSRYSYFSADAAPPEKAVYVNEPEWKAYIVSTTDAYSIGIDVPASRREAYGWVSIPLPDYTSNLYAIYPAAKPLSAIAEQYLRELEDLFEENKE